MRKIGFMLLISALSAPSIAVAVSSLQLDGANHINVTTIPQQIVVSFETQSTIKNAVEIYRDLNRNQQIDTSDRRIHFLYLVDGVGWIRDNAGAANDIPGDEDPTVGRIQTTLTFDEFSKPHSNEHWIVRVENENEGAATAQIHWELSFQGTSIKGVVKNETTGAGLPNVLVHLQSLDTDKEIIAVTDKTGYYQTDLVAGDYAVFTSQLGQQSHFLQAPEFVKVGRNQHKQVNINCTPYKSFVKGRLTKTQSDEPVVDITLTLQNLDDRTLYQTATDSQGVYSMGVKPGTYLLELNQYVSHTGGNSNWPCGYYAVSDADTIVVNASQSFTRNFDFRPYPATINGVCKMDGKPVGGVLVQGVSVDPQTGEQHLYQTFSKADGSYELGVFQHAVTSVYAQKQGMITAPANGYSRLDLQQTANLNNIDFYLQQQSGVMGLSGRVSLEDENPAENILVVAFNPWEASPDGHLFARTDANGCYHFEIKTEGSWQIGVYKNNFQAVPEMHYVYLNRGMQYRNLNFTLSSKKQDMLTSGDMEIVDFNILPHMPNPLYEQTIIEFILPHAGYATVDVLDADGKEIATLVDNELSSGVQKISWDGRDKDGNLIADGIYFCRVKADHNEATRPITLIR